MSILQKAIRRGREDLALRAAATLLSDSPERLWRRSGIIAFEDMGVADLATTGMVVAALGGKAFRAKLGGEWPVASTLVLAMARAPKCRAVDDLLMIVERQPKLEEARRTYSTLATRDLLGIATGSDPLPKRALALCYAIGTNRRPSDHLRPRGGEPHAVFDYLFEAGFPASAVEIAREGHLKISEPLCNFLLMLGSLQPFRPMFALRMNVQLHRAPDRQSDGNRLSGGFLPSRGRRGTAELRPKRALVAVPAEHREGGERSLSLAAYADMFPIEARSNALRRAITTGETFWTRRGRGTNSGQ